MNLSLASVFRCSLKKYVKSGSSVLEDYYFPAMPSLEGVVRLAQTFDQPTNQKNES
jgi:hypothetical protein